MDSRFSEVFSGVAKLSHSIKLKLHRLFDFVTRLLQAFGACYGAQFQTRGCPLLVFIACEVNCQKSDEDRTSILFEETYKTVSHCHAPKVKPAYPQSTTSRPPMQFLQQRAQAVFLPGVFRQA